MQSGYACAPNARHIENVNVGIYELSGREMVEYGQLLCGTTANLTLNNAYCVSRRLQSFPFASRQGTVLARSASSRPLVIIVPTLVSGPQSFDPKAVKLWQPAKPHQLHSSARTERQTAKSAPSIEHPHPHPHPHPRTTPGTTI